MKRFEDFVEGLQEDLVIPNHVDEKFEEALKMVGKQNKTHKFTGIKVAAAAMAVVVAGGAVGISNPTLASKIPVIGHIFEQVENKAVYPGEFSEKQTLSKEKTVDGKLTAEDQGLKITASEVYSDGFSVFVSLRMDYDQCDFSKIPETVVNNAQMITLGASHAIDKEANTKDYGFDVILSGENEGKHSFIGIAKFNKDDISDASGLLNIAVREVMLEGQDENSKADTEGLKRVKGTWDLKIPFTVGQNAGKEIAVNQKTDKGLTVQKIFVSPYQVVAFSDVPYTMPYAKMTDEEILKDYDEKLDFDSEEEKAEVIEETRNEKQYEYYEMAVFDQDGNRLQFQEVGDQGQSGDLQEDLFSVEGKEISKLHVYVMQNEERMFELIKSKTEKQAKKIAEMDFEVEVK